MRKLNRNQIKYLVIIAMVLDHIGWAFFPMGSWTGQFLHFVGRLTGPTMAYFLEEGYEHTKDPKRYAMRLGIFALISAVPYALFESGRLIYLQQNVIYTLFLGFLAMWVWDKGQCGESKKKWIVSALVVLSVIGDWPVMDVLCPFLMFRNRDNQREKWNSFLLVSFISFIMSVTGWEPLWYGAFSLGMVLPCILLRYCYNGEQGSKSPFHKWFFYIFYPAHLLVLWYLRDRMGITLY